MKYIFTLLYTLNTLRKILLTTILGVGAWMCYGQQSNLISNDFTPLQTDLLPGLTVTSSETCVTFICTDDFSNNGNVIDPVLTNSSEWTVLLSVGGSAWIEVEDGAATGSEVYPGGSYAGFVVADNGILSLLNNITITTYLNGVVQESVTSTGLLSLGLLSGQTRIGFFTDSTKDFDKIRLTANIPVGVGANVTVFYAEVMKFEAASSLTCNVPTVMNRPEFPLTVSTGGDLVSSVTNPENAVDANTTNYASLGVLVAGSASLAIQDEISSYPANTYVGFDIENTSLLSLELLADITITTYLDDAVAEIHAGTGQLASLGLLGSTASRIGFLTTQEFDEVEISISSVGANLGTTRVYNAVIQCFTDGPALTNCNEPTLLTAPTYPVYISERTGISGTLNANAEIVDAANVIDVNPSNFAELNFLATVGSEISLGVKDAVTDYASGTFVGFDIENTGSVLDLELLNSITITSYLNGMEQESVGGSSLILGADLLTGNNRHTVGFVTTTAVDEVVITLDGGLLGVSLGSTNVYGAIFQCFTAGPGLAACNNYTRPTAPEYPLTISRTGITGAACALCDITNTNDIIDEDPANYAELNFTAPVGATMTVGVKDQKTDYEAGTFAGFDIENTASLLDLAVLNSITISTYLNGDLKESSTGENLAIGATLLEGSERQTVGFVTTTSFDEVVLSLNGNVAGASLGITRVYSLVLKCFAEGPALACNTNTYMTESEYPYYINFANTGVDGTIGVGNQISDLSHLLDDDTDNFASITQTASTGTATIAIQKALSPVPSGTYVAFDIENPNLLGAELLDGLTVATYSNGTLVESVETGDLISISSSILTGTGRQKVGFIAGGAFDEVRLSVNASLIGLNLGTTRVYGLVLQNFCPGPPLDCNVHSILYGGPSGHPVIVNGQRTGVDGVACAGCQINNPDNAIDNDVNTAATISLVGGVGASADFSVLNALDTYQAGTFAGFDIGTPNLIGVDVLDNFTLTTYLDGVQQEQVTIPSAIISATSTLVANDGREVIGFVTTADFDEIQISLNKLVAADVGAVNIYSTIVQRACAGSVDCSQAYQWLTPDFPLVVEGPHTGVDGLASVIGAAINPWNLINQNTADYAVLVAPVGVLSPAAISIKDAVSEYPTGTTVGFTVRSANSLLQADLLEAVTITTYNNGVEVESASATNLINLDLLVPLLGTGGTAYNVGFVTSAPFDEVQISLTSLLSAVNVLNVYSPFVDIRTAVDENGNALCPQISKEPDFNVTFINVPVDGNVNTNDEVPAGTTYGTPVADGGNPGGGSITMNSNGTYNFVATTPGTYHYQVPVCVPDEPTPCPTTRLTITVLDNTDPTTNPPVANTDYGTALSNSSIEVATLANDGPGYPEASLVPGSVSITTPPTHGTTSIDPGTGNITYTPNTGFVGKDSLMYQVCDDSSPPLCATAWQIFTVIPAGSPNTTTAVDDYIFIEEGSAGTGNVATNDSDAEGNTQTVQPQNATMPGIGTFVLSASGDYTFTPEVGFSGPVDIVYTTCDNGDPQACSSATLHVLVGAAVPDLTINITITPAIFFGTQSFDITVRVLEVSNVNTVGPIQANVRATSTWTNSLTSGDILGDWTYMGTAGVNHIFIFNNATISGSSFSEFQFPAIFNGGGQGEFTFTASIASNSGGETNTTNNSDQETSLYFP